MAKTGVQNYVNTIIFCVVMKIIAIIILGAILLGYVNDKFVYFLITLELGIVMIVVVALWSISTYEKRVATEAQNLMKSKMSLISCPDYHTLTSSNVCRGDYVTPDGRFTYTLLSGSNVSLSNYLNKPVMEACDAYTTFLTRHSNVPFPWTDMSSKCDVL